MAGMAVVSGSVVEVLGVVRASILGSVCPKLFLCLSFTTADGRRCPWGAVEGGGWIGSVKPMSLVWTEAMSKWVNPVNTVVRW